jgi:hypothetical protein
MGKGAEAAVFAVGGAAARAAAGAPSRARVATVTMRLIRGIPKAELAVDPAG